MGHSPHLKSLRPKVELLKGPFSGEHCKKETLCLCVCVCVDLLDRSKTCTVSAGRHSISLGLCPTELPVIWDTGSDQSIVSAF